jgi:hypothetical protein
MATSVQQLKAYGHLPEIGLDRLPDLASREAARAIDSSIIAGRVCGVPDYADDEIADFMGESEDSQKIRELGESLGLPPEETHYLVSMHHSLRDMYRRETQNSTVPSTIGLEAKSGRGSYPAGCYPELSTDRHAIYYHINYDSFPDHYKYAIGQAELESLVTNSRVWNVTLEYLLDTWLGKPMIDVNLWLMVETYRRCGIWMERTEDRAKANIRILSRFISGSTIGIGWFPGSTCNEHVEFHIDNSWKPDLDNCNLLFNHECGHTHSLPHTFSGQTSHKGVMSYNWPSHTYGYLTGDEGILPRDPSWGQLQRQYGTEPFPREDPLPPVLDPGYNGIVILDGQPRKIKVLPIGQMEGSDGVFTHASEILGFKLLD